MSTAAEKPSYKQSLNLPQTAFPMEAKLVQNEPKRLAEWEAMHLYESVQRAHATDPVWVLHDGPPFANGDIHIGHVVNKTLKDVILRFKTMQGHATPYVPGWDCHGLPIEHKVQEEAKKKGEKLHELGVLEVRKRCQAYAQKYVEVQREQFKRLGILGDWSRPYMTMSPEFEASTLEVFAKFVEAGLVYRKLKPVPWSIANQTALADAELEYQDVEDESVYVEFQLLSPPLAPPSGGGEPPQSGGLTDGTSLLIWTTTPWTLPANLVVAVGAGIDYAKVKFTVEGREKTVIIAADLVEKVFALDGSVHPTVTAVVKGSDLVGLTYRHPFIDRTGRVVAADYVTTTDGTGLVHTAPGHGEDDYETGLREKLDVYSPVLANGRYDDTAPDWLVGKSVWEANPLIIDRLKADGSLFAQQRIKHSYPHDWRSKTKIIFRATEQWFVAMDKPFSPSPGNPGLDRGEGDFERRTSSEGPSHPHPLPEYRERGPESLRDRAMAAVNAGRLNEQFAEARAIIEKVYDPTQLTADLDPSAKVAVEQFGVNPSLKGLMQDTVGYFKRHLVGDTKAVDFVPAWGRNRIDGMLKTRPDWCVSRQRAWGLPIPVFYNDKGEPLLTPASVRAVAKKVAASGSDVWFTEEPAALLGGDFVYPPGFTPTNLRKEKDIFDVWFESGSSWAGVLKSRGMPFPADLYLEGSDQHRGWFQLSLLPSLGATGVPPFKQVLTHGFVVKPDGTKVSKSDKEYVTATAEINRHGADVLRLWVCSVDYQNDIPASPKALTDFADKYRKIRNTLRYLLSNLYDFDAPVAVPVESLDGWMTDQIDQLITDVTAAYDGYQLHRAFRLLHDFCSVQVSSIYGNASKDRLYCDKPDSPLRRRCQTVMHRTAVVLTKLLAPMIVFTADEAWGSITQKPAGESELASVHLATFPKTSGQVVTDDTRAEWATLMDLRATALGQLDELKKQAGLNKAGEAEIVYRLPDGLRDRLAAYGLDLEDAAVCGSFKIESAEAPSVQVNDAREKYALCARCWKRRATVVDELCDRCTAAIAMNQT
jgi:isoleucyl-tRNA synthetase